MEFKFPLAFRITLDKFGINATQLAKASNISQQTISTFRNGHTFPQLDKFEQIFNCLTPEQQRFLLTQVIDLDPAARPELGMQVQQMSSVAELLLLQELVTDRLRDLLDLREAKPQLEPEQSQTPAGKTRSRKVQVESVRNQLEGTVITTNGRRILVSEADRERVVAILREWETLSELTAEAWRLEYQSELNQWVLRDAAEQLLWRYRVTTGELFIGVDRSTWIQQFRSLLAAVTHYSPEPALAQTAGRWLVQLDFALDEAKGNEAQFLQILFRLS
ncbi:helix-turn-helix transcriptional regulator [Microcoleus sp. FACHB-1515]|uniref:helix-turn-helix domain-containing protein n=1 Tax=Cyanophyceae TaxID=3028117 RepID=UPI0016863E52|nr:helix-turn-helix transcriptional regulator [Microcoleus sp. FACHB-1515]MBD2093241.1 helix-turn-helix transcriptional regulator [Microcoleus sp. FACHB-1515]